MKLWLFSHEKKREWEGEWINSWPLALQHSPSTLDLSEERWCGDAEEEDTMTWRSGSDGGLDEEEYGGGGARDGEGGVRDGDVWYIYMYLCNLFYKQSIEKCNF